MFALRRLSPLCTQQTRPFFASSGRAMLASAMGHRHFTTDVGTAKSNVIVQKFGGTSLGTPEKMAKVNDIIQRFKKESNVVAVLSALSSHQKQNGTTSRLLMAAEAAVQQQDFNQHIVHIENMHLDVTYGMINSQTQREQMKAFISHELEEIRAFCSSLSVIREISPRSHDKIIGCGERLSAGLVNAILRDQGYDSEYVDLSRAFTTSLDCSERECQLRAKQGIHDRLDDIVSNDAIAVVTGFIGGVEGGIINNIGRGYTDFTAALCAGAVNAKALQVWKESDGVFTANPTKFDQAKLLSSVMPDEAAELTDFGNEVLHPFTMKVAMENNVPIHILNTFKPESQGTTILMDDYSAVQREIGPFGILAVCSKNDITVINVSSEERNTRMLGRVVEFCHKHDVKIDLVSSSMSNISVTVHESVPMENVQSLIDDLNNHYHWSATMKTNRAIISIIGHEMNKQVGLAAKVFECVGKEGISLEMIAQGASGISVSMVVDAEHMNAAVRSIHDNLVVVDELDKMES